MKRQKKISLSALLIVSSLMFAGTGPLQAAEMADIKGLGYGFAVTKGSDIREALSRHVDRLRSTGVYYKMLQRTLGPEAIEVVKAAESEK